MRKLKIKLLILGFIVLASCREPLSNVFSPGSISEIRNSLIGEKQKFDETSIIGVVVSDPNNMENGIIAVQQKDANAAILLELVTAMNFNAGDEVEINLKGASLYWFENELRVRYISSVQVVKTGNKVYVEPVLIDVKSMATSAKSWGPVLVKMNNLIMDSNASTLAGKNKISDDNGVCYMTILSSSDMAKASFQQTLAQLKGIARVSGGDSLNIYPREKTDLMFLTEDFELGSTTGYDTELVGFLTGGWIISGGIVATSAPDAKNGRQSVRLQGRADRENQLGSLEMNFDVKGVRGLKFCYGLYPASAEVANANQVSLSVEYSLDKGESYQLLDVVIYDVSSYVGPRPAPDTLREAKFLFDETKVSIRAGQDVRFRITNTSDELRESEIKPRLNVDDVTFIY